MKRIAPAIVVAAVVLIAVSLVLKHQDPASAYTDDREAWEAYMEGERLAQSFRYAEADSLLHKALALDPGFSMARATLGELFIRRGMSPESRVQYALADSLSDLVSDDLGRLILQVRLSNAGISKYSAGRDSLLALAREKAPEEPIVLITEAGIASMNGDMARAEEIWNHLLEINPNYAAAYNFLGYLYLGTGRYDEAETAMRRYAFVAPDLANPHDSLGEVLMTLGRYEEAEVEFRTALAKQPDFFYSHINLGRIYLNRGEVDRALSLLDRIHTEIAETALGRNLRADMINRLFAHRIYGAVATYATAFLAKNPTGPAVDHVRVRQELANGRVDAARATIDSLATVYQDKPWYGKNELDTRQVDISVLRLQALAAEQVGAHDEAARLLQESLALQQDHPPHYQVFDRIHLAYNLVPLRAFDEARVQIGEVLKINPRVSEGVLVAATIEAAAGQINEARRLLDTVERILERADPDFPVLLDTRRLRERLPDPDRI